MKSKIAAGVLALFVGVFGVHRFYLGQVGKGILYAVFCWFPLTWLIAFIDGIVILTMNDEDFNIKYNPSMYRGRSHDVNININTEGGRTSMNTNRRNRDDVYEQQRPKRNRTNASASKRAVSKSNPYKVEGTEMYRDFDFQGAIAAYLKSLRVQPNDSQIHFNLACLYSLEENAQAAFTHLRKGVEQGYSNFDKIRSHDHLAFLRTQPEFEAFVKNGYTFAKRQEQPMLVAEQPKTLELTNDVIEKLERLALLKDKGILTEDEFQMQKAKLLEL
ncbi:MAG: TM2 domain-containing membrane protein YozV [Cognaticolwellia sp.]|jgi:TM2 domain-containing membrane protein YozV